MEITIPLEQMLEIYVANPPEAEGIIITKDLKYHGFMTAQSLLSTLNEKNLAYARDMNSDQTPGGEQPYKQLPQQSI